TTPRTIVSLHDALPIFPIPPPATDRLVQVLVTHPGDGIRAAALAAVAAARHSIDLEMFVLSDRLILDALVAAARRGVGLRALLRSEDHTSELQSRFDLV